MHISPRLSKAARALVDWSQKDLAEKAELGFRTVMDFESGKRSQQSAATLAQIKRTFEDAGIKFGDDGCVCPPKEQV